MARPRLLGSSTVIPETLAQVQVAVNDVACSVVGCKREDHVTIVDLLEASKYLSLNHKVVKATAMSVWSAFHSFDGSNRTKKPIGNEMFGTANLLMARTSRRQQQARSGSGRGGWTPT
jgi:hypothetical protein